VNLSDGTYCDAYHCKRLRCSRPTAGHISL